MSSSIIISIMAEQIYPSIHLSVFAQKNSNFFILSKQMFKQMAPQLMPYWGFACRKCAPEGWKATISLFKM